jgi:hypothetical protein
VAGIPVVSCIPEVNGAGEERNPKEIVDILRLDTRYYGDVDEALSPKPRRRQSADRQAKKTHLRRHLNLLSQYREVRINLALRARGGEGRQCLQPDRAASAGQVS